MHAQIELSFRTFTIHVCSKASTEGWIRLEQLECQVLTYIGPAEGVIRPASRRKHSSIAPVSCQCCPSVYVLFVDVLVSLPNRKVVVSHVKVGDAVASLHARDIRVSSMAGLELTANFSNNRQL